MLQEHTFATISMLSGLSRVRVLQAIFDVGLPNREYCDSWKNLTGPGYPGGAGLPLQERLCPEDGLLLPGCPPNLLLMLVAQPDETEEDRTDIAGLKATKKSQRSIAAMNLKAKKKTPGDKISEKIPYFFEDFPKER